MFDIIFMIHFVYMFVQLECGVCISEKKWTKLFKARCSSNMSVYFIAIKVDFEPLFLYLKSHEILCSLPHHEDCLDSFQSIFCIKTQLFKQSTYYLS